MTSIAISPYTMPAALAAGDNLLGKQEWVANSSNNEQAEWLEKYPQRAKIAGSLPEIESNATDIIDQHIGWLGKRGWSAAVTKGSRGDVYLASVLSAGGKWLTPGTSYSDSTTNLKRAVLKEVFVSTAKKYARIPTQQEDIEFWVQEVGTTIIDSAGLAKAANEMMQEMGDDITEEGILNFPMVNLRYRKAADYMIGLRSGINEVTQADEGYELKMNHLAGRAKAKAEVAVSRGIDMKPLLTINGPFLVLVVKEGVNEPLFAAYVDRDSWRDPGDVA